MKIISFPKSEKSLVVKAQKEDRLSQKALFDLYAPKMLSVCRQYIKDLQFAEDVMITAFAKALKALDTFDTDKSFRAWLKKMVLLIFHRKTSRTT